MFEGRKVSAEFEVDQRSSEEFAEGECVEGKQGDKIWKKHLHEGGWEDKKKRRK